MPGRKEIADELNFLSGLLSERIRFLAAGTLAFCWAFIIEGMASDRAPFLQPAFALPPVILALLGLVADFLQYWCGYRLNISLLRRLERDGETEVSYDKGHPFYRLREGMFRAKIVLVCASVFFLLAAVSVRLMQLFEFGTD